ncbi:unnamed protein product, partial [Owenia fusiformis]
PKMTKSPKNDKRNSTTELTIRWDAWNISGEDLGDGPIKHYTLFYHPSNDSLNTKKTTTSNTFWTIKNLAKDTYYNFSVTPNDVGCEGRIGPPLVQKTCG